MKPVKSSNIEAVGYDAATRKLTVHFKNGSKHDYADVPADTHAAMMKADSVGGFFHKHVRSAFKSSRVKDD